MESGQAFRELREGKIRPVYVCCGMEAYRMNEFTEQLVSRLVEPEHREMAIMRYNTSEHSIDEIIDEAETLPFLVPHKLVIVRDSVVFASSGKEAAKIEHRPERLLEYMRSPMETTVLVFIVPHEKLDERKKVSKAAKQSDAVVNFSPLSAEELMQWVARRAEKQRRTIEPAALTELLRRVGTDMAALAAETDKLCLHAGENGTVTAQSVADLVPASTEQSVFKLTEEIAALRTDRALAIYYDLLKQREEPIKLTALLVRQFRNMLFIKELSRQGYTPQQIAGQTGLHPYAVKMMGEHIRSFSTDRLARILERLAELDYAMKTGRVEKTLGLELFLMETGARGG
ncbi:DNA polymerase III subunit delta [Cohnella laeviribosi]|jgi:DNA polymerase-3 subunit delta|uniref:DNA polymerase III subunit delta n=1 Tax=Cohnella laeviribosi TaxID=380174 RepID=UPI00037664FC|nr:DNA polymerase III subunit delta [Cohnella laeviribosi]